MARWEPHRAERWQESGRDDHGGYGSGRRGGGACQAPNAPLSGAAALRRPRASCPRAGSHCASLERCRSGRALAIAIGARDEAYRFRARLALLDGRRWRNGDGDAAALSAAQADRPRPHPERGDLVQAAHRARTRGAGPRSLSLQLRPRLDARERRAVHGAGCRGERPRRPFRASALEREVLRRGGGGTPRHRPGKDRGRPLEG